MFLGTFEPNLMEKGRFVLPKKIREELDRNSVILTIGLETCIFGFDEATWEEVTKSEIARPLFSDKEGRDLRRKMFSEAIRIEIDTQGRCTVPEALVNFAQIKQFLVIIGAGDHFEIWDKSNWQEYSEKLTTFR